MRTSRDKITKAVVVIVVLGLAAAFMALGLGRYLTLEFLKHSQGRFASYYEQHAAFVLLAYAGVYIAVTALSLPGAAVMTLAGGGLFGLATGAVVVSFASSIGATLACAAARYVLRDWVQGRFGGRLEAINRGIEEEGAFYLFSLRLIPVFPFFLINLAMGLTRMRLKTYYWVSQLGMLPATIVYVNAGGELAKVDSLAGVLSPRLIASFAAIGLLPLAARRLVLIYRLRRGRARPD